MDIWSAFTRKKFPISLDQAKGRAKQDGSYDLEFARPGAQFVLTVMQGINPTITAAEVSGGIRSSPRHRPKVKKTNASAR
jgi:hypothetical protein